MQARRWPPPSNASRRMPESLSNWLGLREPADTAARSTDLTHLIADKLPRDRTIRIVDLGTGTGSNVRYLASRLAGPQEWLVVDRDPALLAEAAAALRPLRNVVVETFEMDLGRLDST